MELDEKVPKAALRVYEALANYVSAKGLNPHAFGMDYRRLANLAGYVSKDDARRGVLEAEEAKLLHRLHRGAPHRAGCRGTPALFCLRGEGETLDQAVAAGTGSKQYQLRQVATSSAAIPKPDFWGALRWDELRKADRGRYSDVCDMLKDSQHLPEEGKPLLRMPVFARFQPSSDVLQHALAA
jgi:hypothetical protein